MGLRYHRRNKNQRRTGGGRYAKYNTAPVLDRTIDGIKFASKLEATRYSQLKLLVKAGQIDNLKMQPRFVIDDKFGDYKRDLVYVADFMYDERGNDKKVVEEVKGYETKVWKIKERLFLHRYGDKYDFRVLTADHI